MALVSADRQSEFLIHLGDVVSGSKKRWPEAQYAKIAGILKRSKVPVFVVPGDNEWNDLDDPVEGWQFWSRHFLDFDKHCSYEPTVNRQPARAENMAWVTKGVLMVGINLVGGRVHDAKEWETRMQQDVDWVRVNLRLHHKDVRAAVVFAQAEPKPEHEPFFKDFVKAAKAFGKPILYLHADGHVWQERPGWRKTPNLLRVQTDQLGRNPPVLVTVTDDPQQPFVFDRRLAK